MQFPKVEARKTKSVKFGSQAVFSLRERRYFLVFMTFTLKVLHLVCFSPRYIFAKQEHIFAKQEDSSLSAESLSGSQLRERIKDLFASAQWQYSDSSMK